MGARGQPENSGILLVEVNKVFIREKPPLHSLHILVSDPSVDSAHQALMQMLLYNVWGISSRH